jgi:uncharacterized phage-associated protein
LVCVLDVAAYILEKHGPMTAMKLQKLVYYSQAWSIVWDHDSLFPEEIEAWSNGPIVPRLWDAHWGEFRVSRVQGGDATPLTRKQRETVDAVLKFYGPKNAQWLSELTHMEDPWKKAWAQGSNTVISKSGLAEYYSGIEPPGGQQA